MTVMEAVIKMSKGREDATFAIVHDFRKNHDALVLADELEIHGSELWTLYKDCCGLDSSKFKRTIDLLNSGTFTDQQIKANLQGYDAVPFIDESVTVDDVFPYESDFGPHHPKWKRWCQAQKASFESRFNLK